MSQFRIHYSPNTLLAGYNETTKKLIGSPITYSSLDCCCFLDPTHEYWHPDAVYVIGDFAIESAFERRERWSSTKNYTKYYLTRISLGGLPIVYKYYRSLQDDNLNHNPTTSPEWWLYLGEGLAGEAPIGGVYRSKTNNNIGRMVSNSDYWTRLTYLTIPCGNPDWNAYPPYGGPGKTPQYYRIHPSGIRLDYGKEVFFSCPYCGEEAAEDCAKALKWVGDPASPWSSATNYDADDLAYYNGDNYRSLQINNLNNQPDSSPTWWEKIPLSCVLTNEGYCGFTKAVPILYRCPNGHWYQSKNESGIDITAYTYLQLSGKAAFYDITSLCGTLSIDVGYDLVFLQTFPLCQLSGNLSNALQRSGWTGSPPYYRHRYCMNPSTCHTGEVYENAADWCPTGKELLYLPDAYIPPGYGGSIAYHPL